MLEDVAHLVDYCNVFVFLHVPVVQRLRVTWLTIRHCEIDSDRQINVTPAKHVFKEGMLLLEDDFVQCASVFPGHI